MAPNRFARLVGRSAVIWLATCVLQSAHIAAARSSLCLTPAAEPALKELFASPVFGEALGPERHLEGVNLRGDEIDLQIADSQRQHRMTLALNERSDRAADGRGTRFVYYLALDSASGNPDSTRSLLSVATLVDRAIPTSAFAECKTSSGTERRSAPYGEGYPRALALFSAAIQILALIAAVAFGARAIRHPR